MDGAFFNDLRSPFIVANPASVTLSTTDKALYTAAVHPTLGANYWWAGKRIALILFGRITTVLTPGNGTWDIYWGSGADANGTIIASSAAQALTASQTNLSWRLELDIFCPTIGATGSLFCTGLAIFNEAVVAPKMLIPASVPAAVTVDTTAANIISVQFKRSGSTVETMQVHDFQFIAKN